MNNISGDTANFEMLFKTHFKPLCFFAQKYINDIDASKNIVHDVFVKLWENKDKTKISVDLKSYLYTAVYNRSLNYIRDNKKFAKEEFVPENFNETELFDYSENSDLILIQERIFSTLDNLSDKTRKVFEMSRYENLKYHEIAEKLGISVKTVETHMSKALSILRKNLKEFLSVLIFLQIN